MTKLKFLIAAVLLAAIISVLVAIKHPSFASAAHESGSAKAGMSKNSASNKQSNHAQPEEEPLLKQQSDFLKLPSPPPPPESAKDLRRLVARINAADFPECRAPFEKPGDSGLCLSRLSYETSKIRGIRKGALLDDLIKIASAKNLDKNPFANVDDQRMADDYRDFHCLMRYNAIYSIGEMRDKRAVGALLKLLDEPAQIDDASQTGCAIYQSGAGDDEATFTCTEASRALSKMADARLISVLLEPVNQLRSDVETDSAKPIYMNAYCHLSILPGLGKEALEKSLEKYNEADVSESGKYILRQAVISETRDKRSFPVLFKLLSSQDKELARSAAWGLALIADPNRVNDYVWMLNNGYADEALVALRTIKDPNNIPIILELLKDGDINNDEAAARALSEFQPLSPSTIPYLEYALSNCRQPSHSCSNVISCLILSGDPNAANLLYQHINQNHSQGASYNEIKELINIDSAESKRYALELIDGASLYKNIPNKKIANDTRCIALDLFLMKYGVADLPKKDALINEAEIGERAKEIISRHSGSGNKEK